MEIISDSITRCHVVELAYADASLYDVGSPASVMNILGEYLSVVWESCLDLLGMITLTGSSLMIISLVGDPLCESLLRFLSESASPVEVFAVMKDSGHKDKTHPPRCRVATPVRGERGGTTGVLDRRVGEERERERDARSRRDNEAHGDAARQHKRHELSRRQGTRTQVYVY